MIAQYKCDIAWKHKREFCRACYEEDVAADGGFNDYGPGGPSQHTCICECEKPMQPKPTTMCSSCPHTFSSHYITFDNTETGCIWCTKWADDQKDGKYVLSGCKGFGLLYKPSMKISFDEKVAQQYDR